jgi:anti-sigma-K factor RskA
MPSNVDAQLTWLATRYVLGELSEADRATFEQRLADDLVACEAVVEASRLKSGLRAALAKLEPGLDDVPPSLTAGGRNRCDSGCLFARGVPDPVASEFARSDSFAFWCRIGGIGRAMANRDEFQRRGSG